MISSYGCDHQNGGGCAFKCYKTGIVKDTCLHHCSLLATCLGISETPDEGKCWLYMSVAHCPESWEPLCHNVASNVNELVGEIGTFFGGTHCHTKQGIILVQISL